MFCILVEKSPKIALHFGRNPQMQNYLGGEDMELWDLQKKSVPWLRGRMLKCVCKKNKELMRVQKNKEFRLLGFCNDLLCVSCFANMYLKIFPEMKKGCFLKFSLFNVWNSPSEPVFYFVRRKYASFSLNFSQLVLMICLFVPFPLSGPASFGQFACLDLAPCFVWPLPFLGDFFLWSFARVFIIILHWFKEE